jgi:hypothetical protein
VQNILMKPAPEWEKIDGEPASVNSLFLGYACVLALIPVVASILGGLLNALVFHSILGVVGTLISTLVVAVLTYVISLGAVYVFGLIINALATSFGGTANAIQAMKVAVYGMTAAWVSGIFGFIPVLGLLIGLLGLGYSFYLIYLGVARLMKPPADKAVGYAAVSLAIYVVLYFVLVFIIGIISAIVLATAGAAAVTTTAVGAAATH